VSISGVNYDPGAGIAIGKSIVVIKFLMSDGIRHLV
jgi:hypothetical protein